MPVRYEPVVFEPKLVNDCVDLRFGLLSFGCVLLKAGCRCRKSHQDLTCGTLDLAHEVAHKMSDRLMSRRPPGTGKDVLSRYYRGDLISALVAYNSRPRKIFAPIPRNGETPRHVAAILKYYRSYLRLARSRTKVQA